MAETPAENPRGSHIPPLLRQRMLKRAATFSEGAPPRRSSNLSDASDTRHALRCSTDSLLRPPATNDMHKLATADDASLWHHVPLVVYVLPAFINIFIQNGGDAVHDVILLGIGSLFLNWCLRSPWEWYHAAQQRRYVDDEEWERDDTILDEDDDEGNEPSTTGSAKPSDQANGKNAADNDDAPSTRKRDEARQELRWNEMMALFACFIGPLAGGCLLHAVRSQLTHRPGSLTSNVSFTIFVMAAEIRPMHHIIKMKEARMLYLQRIVRQDSDPEYRKVDIQDLSNRLASLEARAGEPSQSSDLDVQKISAIVRQGTQPQLDALNRAVRRYEKRQAAQSIQMEARFQELEKSNRDALALAAAAARTGQRPGVVAIMLTWIGNLFAYGMQTSWTIATYPYRTVTEIVTRARHYVRGEDRQPRKRIKGGQTYAHPPASTSKVQSRSGR